MVKCDIDGFYPLTVIEVTFSLKNLSHLKNEKLWSLKNEYYNIPSSTYDFFHDANLSLFVCLISLSFCFSLPALFRNLYTVRD